jgi:hypothetical protein
VALQIEVDMADEKLLCNDDLTDSQTGFTSSELILSVQIFCNLLKYESKFSLEAEVAEARASDSLADFTWWPSIEMTLLLRFS